MPKRARALSQIVALARDHGLTAAEINVAMSASGPTVAAQPESRYSMTELTIADAFEDLPLEMRQRLAGGEKTGE